MKAVSAIKACRTNLLGSHVTRCNQCAKEETSYNSCRNRHCPKCQGSNSLKWVQGKLKHLLPIKWYHIVFTLPHELNFIILHNKKRMYDQMFKLSSETLKTFGRDSKWLGADIGIISVLHTWGQNLEFHPHIQCIVSSGGLSEKKWKEASKSFLFPVKALSKVFRGKFMEMLKKKNVDLPEAWSMNQWENVKRICYKKSWNVFAKSPLKRPENVMKYLGLYTHKVAINNQRLVSLENGKVKFKYRDSKDAQKQKEMTLSVKEFIRRFLLHIIPKGFVRIRSSGILSNSCYKEKLNEARNSLKRAIEKMSKELKHYLNEISEYLINRCPNCKSGVMEFVESAKGKYLLKQI